MAKRIGAEFNRKLRKLFDERTYWLRKAISKGTSGRPPEMSKNKISRAIIHLQDLASHAISTSLTKREFEKIVKQKKQWHVKSSKGWGWREKKRAFNRWFEEHIHYPNCIYIFWANNKCIYVGRTVNGKGRPQSHFDKVWFSGVTRLDIHSTASASQVPKLECLAIHRFQPKENGVSASIAKWAKKCPVCKLRKNINQEIRKIFRLRG